MKFTPIFTDSQLRDISAALKAYSASINPDSFDSSVRHFFECDKRRTLELADQIDKCLNSENVNVASFVE